MGMFDSLYDEHGNEWQTKAFDCNLDEYGIGDTIPAECDASYQVEILGAIPGDDFRYSLATVRSNVLVAVHDERDDTLPFLNYSGHVVAEGR